MEMYRGQAEELAQRVEKQAADLRRELAKSQEFVDKMSREIEPQIHDKMNEAVTQAANEFAGATARAAERSTDQFRKSMKAFLYSCLVAAVSAVDEHSKSTLDGLLKDNGKTLHEG